jgi:hypothetical protein
MNFKPQQLRVKTLMLGGVVGLVMVKIKWFGIVWSLPTREGRFCPVNVTHRLRIEN